MWHWTLLYFAVDSERVAGWLERLATFAVDCLAIVAQGVSDHKLLQDDIIVPVTILSVQRNSNLRNILDVRCERDGQM
jgi:hypothetical protein